MPIGVGTPRRLTAMDAREAGRLQGVHDAQKVQGPLNGIFDRRSMRGRAVCSLRWQAQPPRRIRGQDNRENTS